MSYTDDPDFNDIRQEFLAEIRKYHESVAFSHDWKALCLNLGVSVVPGESNQHFHFGSNAVITYSANEVANRQLYTGLHELSHHLFSTSEACFRDLLEDKYPLTLAHDLEEKLCHEGASIMLIPDHIFQSIIATHGYSPKTVFTLSARAGSLAACLLRLLLSHDLEAWGVIVKRNREVESSFTTTKFNLGQGFSIEESHRIHEGWQGYVEIKCALPYASGYRSIKHLMRCESNDRRLVALFAKGFPDVPNASQGTLF